MDWEKILANSVINKGLVSKQTAHIAQYQKNFNNPIKKWTEVEIDFSWKKTDRQPNKHMRKMLSITDYQRKANQNYNEVITSYQSKSFQMGIPWWSSD